MTEHISQCSTFSAVLSGVHEGIQLHEGRIQLVQQSDTLGVGPLVVAPLLSEGEGFLPGVLLEGGDRVVLHEGVLALHLLELGQDGHHVAGALEETVQG